MHSRPRKVQITLFSKEKQDTVWFPHRKQNPTGICGIPWKDNVVDNYPNQSGFYISVKMYRLTLPTVWPPNCLVGLSIPKLVPVTESSPYFRGTT